MKLYNRTKFMELPEGTIYSKGKPWYFDGLFVKGETMSNDKSNIDWYARDLVCIEADDPEAFSYTLDEMLESRISAELNTSYGRDGCFDDEDLFLVYEKSDLMNLEQTIKHAASLAPQLSDPLNALGSQE